MEMQEMNAQAVARQYRMKKTVVVSVGLLLFVLAAAVAFVLCNFQLKYTTQEILNKQRDIQQAWVDKSLESVYPAGLGRQVAGIRPCLARQTCGAGAFHQFGGNVPSVCRGCARPGA